jgi:hypothetical protein
MGTSDSTSTLDAYRGTLPYASERFGIYRPLLGWRSRVRLQRLGEERLAVLREVISGMTGDRRIGKKVAASATPISPSAPLPAKLPTWLGASAAVGVLQQAAAGSAQQAAGAGKVDWKRAVQAASLGTKVSDMATHSTAAARALHALEQGQAAFRAPVAEAAPYVRHEAVIAGVLEHLAENVPDLLDLAVTGKTARWEELLPHLDPLSQFDEPTQQAYLSPLGLLHVFREYFYELDSFLGSPVGHIWLSPGGTLEMFEVHTHRSGESRETVQQSDTLNRSESDTSNKDELSTEIARRSTEDMKAGVTASGGVNFGVFHASASGSLSVGSTQQTSQQDAHKQARAQSQKIASEIRQSFKTTFKSSVDQEDKSSRRYLLQNTTEKLLNIELRRKMRRVAVQTQQIGMQLCWQVFVDNPGRELGIAELVHLAQPNDPSAVQPPDAPAKLADQEVAHQVTVVFQGIDGNTDRSDDYIHGLENGERGDHVIVSNQTYHVTPPAAGFTLGAVTFDSVVSPDPSKHPWLAPVFTIGKDGRSFELHMQQVNFDDQPYLTVKLTLLWKAPPISQADLDEYAKRSADYTVAKQREEHTAYVKAVRERITAASNITKRLAEDLRDEERTAIFRRLLVQLTRAEGRETSHVTSELIREIFDIEKMLYFVAPDWWSPRVRSKQSFGRPPPEPYEDKLPQLRGEPKLSVPQAPPVGAPDSDTTDANALSADDLSGWGGERDPARANYLVTEDSQPAPYGASLGWLIQLDGDERRNAFLNSPWAKAVVPIRPGKEDAALAWLQKENVEGVDGLDATYKGPEPELAGLTVGQVLAELAKQVQAMNQDMDNVLATERAFETGFDPLDGGFRASTEPFAPFDQWIEVLPTDQVVAVEYSVQK